MQFAACKARLHAAFRGIEYSEYRARASLSSGFYSIHYVKPHTDTESANTMPNLTSDQITTWYRSVSGKYSALADSVTSTLASLMKARSVDYLAITSRVKALESVLEKVTRKDYDSLDEMTDILGVRVILYLESDISKVSSLIDEAFQTFPELSVDKSEELAIDQMGYRSMHHICDLGKTRLALPELGAYQGVKFEVQVRTVLQHAWAEIEHDRSYKFPGDLPSQYRRRINLLAGTLELVDREFSSLARDLDEYSRLQKTSKPVESPIAQEIDPSTLHQYISSLPDQAPVDLGRKQQPIGAVAEEVKRFGIQNIDQFSKLLTPEFFAAVMKHAGPTTQIGLIRKALMYEDVERYFAQAWPRSWKSMSTGTREMLCEKYGQQKVAEVMQRYLPSTSNKPPTRVKR